MIRYKDFLHNPISATANGYEAWVTDYWCLWVDMFSFRVGKKALTEWRRLFTDYSMVEFPVEFTKLLIVTIIFLSIPVLFWFYGSISYLMKDKLIEEHNKQWQRAERDLRI